MPGDGVPIARIQLVRKVVMAEPTRRRLQLGNIYVTRELANEVPFAEIVGMLIRHQAMDWGVVSDEDRQANEDAIDSGARVISHYHSIKGVDVLIVTEAENDSCEREQTTALRLEDY